MLGGLNKKDFMESVQNSIGTWDSSPGIWCRYSCCGYSVPGVRHSLEETRVGPALRVSQELEQAWGCGLGGLGAGGNSWCWCWGGAQKRGHTVFSPTRSGQSIATCTKTTLAPSTLPFVCPVWPLTLVTEGGSSTQAGWIFAKLVKFTCSWDCFEARNYLIHKT